MLQNTVDGFAIYEFPAPHMNEEKIAFFFAHANGIPTLSYKSLFEKLSQQLNCTIISYDMRGFGKTTTPAQLSKEKKQQWLWDLLSKDHVNLFQKIKAQKNPNLNWIISGHSLGAWVSLLASKDLPSEKLFLFEPPILAPGIILKWSIAILLNRRHLSPRGQRVKKRKIQFPSLQTAFEELKKSALMKNWPEEVIQDYLEGSFKTLENGGEAILRHNPLWEALMFEEYPMGAWYGFLNIPYSTRKNLELTFFIGEQSDTCNPKAKKWVQLFFPKAKWIILPEANHMFPLERQQQTISLIQNNL